MTTSKFNQMFVNLWKCIDNQQNVNEILETFTTEHTNVDWFVLAFRNLQTFKMLPFENGDQELTYKSSKKSEEWRQIANNTYAYCQEDYGEAFVQYTKSVAHAPYPTANNNHAPELALALGNRSLVLMKMNKLEACQNDIQRALDYNYPQNLAYKLYVRQGKCFQLMGMMENAYKSYLVRKYRFSLVGTVLSCLLAYK